MKKIIIFLILLSSVGCINRTSMIKLETEVMCFNENEIIFFIHNPNSFDVFEAQIRTAFYNKNKELVGEEVSEVPFIAANTAVPLILYHRPENTEYFMVSAELYQKESKQLDYREFVEFNHYDNEKYIVAQVKNVSKEYVDIISVNVVFYKNNKVVSVAKNSVINVGINKEVNFAFSYPKEGFDYYEFQLESALVNLEKTDSEIVVEDQADLEIEEFFSMRDDIYFIFKNHSSNYISSSLSLDEYNENGDLWVNKKTTLLLLEPQGVGVVRFNIYRWSEVEDYSVRVNSSVVAESSEVEIYNKFKWSIEDTGEKIIISSQKIEDNELYNVEGVIVFYKHNEIVEIRGIWMSGPYVSDSGKIKTIVKYPFNISFDRYEIYFTNIEVD